MVVENGREGRTKKGLDLLWMRKVVVRDCIALTRDEPMDRGSFGAFGRTGSVLTSCEINKKLHMNFHHKHPSLYVSLSAFLSEFLEH